MMLSPEGCQAPPAKLPPGKSQIFTAGPPRTETLLSWAPERKAILSESGDQIVAPPASSVPARRRGSSEARSRTQMERSGAPKKATKRPSGEILGVFCPPPAIPCWNENRLTRAGSGGGAGCRVHIRAEQANAATKARAVRWRRSATTSRESGTAGAGSATAGSPVASAAVSTGATKRYPRLGSVSIYRG